MPISTSDIVEPPHPNERLVGGWKKADVKKKQKGRSEEDKLAQQGRKELLNRQLREQKGCEKEKGRKQSRRLREAEDRSE